MPIPVIWETLYKTDVPAELDHAEFYQPRIEEAIVSGKPMFFVTEIHGWFDEKNKTAPNIQKTLDPVRDSDNGFSTIEAAQKAYNAQLQHRASGGFVHSFAWTFDAVHGVAGNRYRRLDVHH